MKLTVDQCLQQIHRIYEGDVDYLAFEDEETQLRVEYIKDGIRDWTDKFPEYREQFMSLVDAADGDKLTTAATTVYTAPSNFIRPAGTVKIGDSIYLNYIEPGSINTYNQNNSNAYWYSITGSPGSYKIRINPVQAASLAINYDYFGEVTLPTLTTQTIPISRPLYCVHYALWKLFSEDDPVRAKQHQDAMMEQERLERVELAKASGSPNRLSFLGAGFGDRSGSVSDIVNDR